MILVRNEMAALMSLWSSGSRTNRTEGTAEPGLTPAQIIEWIRAAGYRAQAELTETAVRIDSGVAGYNMAVWCYPVKDLQEPCQSIQLSLNFGADENIAVGAVKSFANEFNVCWRYVTVSVFDNGGIHMSVDFLTDRFSSTELFASYFSLFESLSQDFRLKINARFYSS